MASLFLVLGLGLSVADCPIGPPLPMHMRVESSELAVVAQVGASWVAHEGPYPLSISQSHGVVITVLETVYGELPAERFELLYDGYQSCVGGGILAEGRTHLLLLRRWGEGKHWTLVSAEVDREGLTPELLRPRVEALRGCRVVDGLPDGTEEERRVRVEAERRWLDSLLVRGLGWEWSIERWYADWRDRHHARQRTVRRFGRWTATPTPVTELPAATVEGLVLDVLRRPLGDPAGRALAWRLRELQRIDLGLWYVAGRVAQWPRLRPEKVRYGI